MGHRHNIHEHKALSKPAVTVFKITPWHAILKSLIVLIQKRWNSINTPWEKWKLITALYSPQYLQFDFIIESPTLCFTLTTDKETNKKWRTWNLQKNKSLFLTGVHCGLPDTFRCNPLSTVSSGRVPAWEEILQRRLVWPGGRALWGGREWVFHCLPGVQSALRGLLQLRWIQLHGIQRRPLPVDHR